jgi:DNA-3-methyladenine glycosylase
MGGCQAWIEMSVDRSRLARASYVVAPRLLGAVLVSTVSDVTVSIRITEVEAYDGSNDAASHAYRGQTRRNEVMFGPAGFLYCYFTYGMHWCANIVCGVAGQATAVLLRAGEVIEGSEVARARRGGSGRDRDLARGPARLASCLGISGLHNGRDLCDPDSDVRLASLARHRRVIRTGPRVGISAATDRQWRFWLDGDVTVSQFRAGRRAPLARSGQTDAS